MEHGPGRETPPRSPTHQANAGRSSGVPAAIVHDMQGQVSVRPRERCAQQPLRASNIFPFISYARVASPCLTKPSNIRRREKPRASISHSFTPNGPLASISSARRAFGLSRRFRGCVAILVPRLIPSPGPLLSYGVERAAGCVGRFAVTARSKPTPVTPL
jgi:hypothetical protein